jgi:hypothetical protein
MSKTIKGIATIAMMGVMVFGMVTCKKETIAPPTVKVFDGAITIGYDKASVSAEVTDQGGTEVKKRGFTYGVSGGAMDTAWCGSGIGVYSTELNNLQPNTPYDYEAFAINAGGTGTSGKVTFTTKPLPSYTIEVSTDPSDGGTATGNGTYQAGESCTVRAKPGTDFKFVKWTEVDTQVSTDSVYTFEVTKNRNLVAHFISLLEPLSLAVSANPGVIAKGGSSQLKATAFGGNGSFTYSWTPSTGLSSTTSQNPTATPNATTTYTCTVTSGSQTINKSCTVKVVCPPTNLAYTVNGNNVELTWTEPNPATTYNVYRDNTLIKQNVNETRYTDPNLSPETYKYKVSTVYSNVESPLSSSVYATVTLQVPQGAINGKFTINANGDQVYFSKGNLQYQASTQKWQFAAKQYDYIGYNNSNISSSYSGWIDLFGWGTSGWNCGNIYYRPWDSNNSDGSLYGPSGNYNLTGSYANSDWGRYNAISNGGNTAGQWRTLTGGSSGEWYYVFNRRNTSSGIRYAKAQVAGVNGVILLPDDWSTSTYSLSNTNASGSSFSSNIISASQWTTLENAGAVFLPAAGSRYGTSVNGVGSNGYYWSASYYNSIYAYSVYFNGSHLYENDYYSHYYGFSVRLVRACQ